MNQQKIKLIIQSIESSLSLLKMELSENDNSGNIVKLEELIGGSIDDYEPSYYEEED